MPPLLPATTDVGRPNPGGCLLLVGVGNVGTGIARAFRRAGWRVTAIDPRPVARPWDGPESTGDGFALRQSTIDELADADFAELLAAADEVVYAAECGNRDEYSAPQLARENAARFRRFAERVARLAGNDAWAPHVAFVGGSWTRRAATAPPSSGLLVVNDDSPAKPAEEANAYEMAKGRAQRDAAALAASLRLRITFYDWASVVPNLAPNFSIAQMTRAALADGAVEYSDGDFGRPLLGAEDAGAALVMLTVDRLASERCRTDRGVPSLAPFTGPTADVSAGGCTTVLLPGLFTTFERFATLVKEEVELAAGPSHGVVLRPQAGGTPAILGARCESALLQRLRFAPRVVAVEEGLREACRAAIAGAREEADRRKGGKKYN